MARYNDNSTYTRLGSIYHNIKTRCSNPNYDKYNYYGGKGITMCDEWLASYDAFESWALEHGYTDDLTIDRIDVNKGYSPDNCRWVTWKEQANNRTSNRHITYNGETKTLQQWAEQFDIKPNTISQRLNSGWPIEQALTQPATTKFYPAPITFNGETHTMAEWSRIKGMTNNAISNRLLRGWTVEEALTIPARPRRKAV